MNTLSMLLYLGDVSGQLQVTFSLIGIFGTAFIVMGTIISSIDPLRNNDTPSYSTMMNVMKRSLIFLPFILIAAILPSKDTVYLIAASELGETVVTSPEARDILNDVRLYLKQSLVQPQSEGK